MFNQDEIKIAQIKDLRLLYFFNCDESLSNVENPYFGLRIVYDNDKKLSYSYKDECFNYYISKVIEVYNKEKNRGNIKFLDDRTKEIFEDIEKFPQVKINKSFEGLQDKKLDCFNNRRTELALITPYIKDLIIKFLWAVRRDENIKINDFRGINDRFACEYMIKNKNFVMPTIVTKKDFSNYDISFSYAKGNPIFLDGSINLRDKSIVSSWVDKEKIITGKNIYHVDEESFEKYVTTAKGMIFYDNAVPQVTETDQKLINKFWKLIGLDSITNIRKTLDNCYILTEKEKVDNNSDLILNKVAHATFDDKMIDIIFNKNYGVEKANNQLFISLDQEITSVIVRLESILDINVLIVQKSFIPGMNSNGQFKKDFVDRYSYDVYVIDGDSLLKPFKVLNKVEINEPIYNVYQLNAKVNNHKGV